MIALVSSARRRVRGRATMLPAAALLPPLLALLLLAPPGTRASSAGAPNTADPGNDSAVGACLPWGCECSPRDVHCADLNITSLTEVSWPSMDADTRLVLSRNGLVELGPDDFASDALARVHSLDLSYNRVARIDDGTFLALSGLRHLQLHHNRLGELSALALDGLAALERLDLSYNRLRNISAGALAPCARLRDLVLRYNPLLCLDPALLAPAYRLELLDLHNVGLAELRADLFANASALTSLDLGSNQLGCVPSDALEPLATLVHLDLSDNPIRRVPAGAFRGLADLEKLHLDTMELLEAVDAHAFDGLQMLRLFSSSFNRRLALVHADAFRSADNPADYACRPKEVRLRQNALARLDQRLLPWMWVEAVDLQENPWHCDCHLQWMQKIVIDKDPSSHEVKCYTPPALSGRRLEGVSLVELVCSDEHGHALLSVVLFLVVFVVVVGVIAAISCWKMRACAKCREAYQQRYKKLSTSGREAERVEMECARGSSRDVEV